MIDIVTVTHNATNEAQAEKLFLDLCLHEFDGFNFIEHSNAENNLGFAKGCNIGASKGNSEIIGFLNPDAEVFGRFIDKVEAALVGEVVVTGCDFGKPASHLREWGVKNWVCGATFFVRRDHFESLGGFDERFEWSFEETDFIRRTEAKGLIVYPQRLPILHSSPTEDSPVDAAYKAEKFAEAQKRYLEKWN